MTLDHKESDAEEVEDKGPTVTSRLSHPLRMRELMDNCTEFSIAVEEEVDREDEVNMMDVYSYDELEPYILTENLEVDSDAEGDENNPVLPFYAYQRKMECISEDGKIKKLLERCGCGPLVTKNSVVYVHYTIYSEHNECPFDSSRLRQKKPQLFRLGHDSMIAGMHLALLTMKKGEKSKFIIDSEYAWGKLGVPPRIPPDSTVLLVLELVDFTESEDVVARYGKEDDEVQEKRTFEQVLHSCEKLRQHGNKLKKLRKDVNGAIRDYRRALCHLVQFHYTNDADEERGRKEMLKLYTNLCVCYMAKNAYKQACAAYNNARHDCPNMAENCPKLLYNSGKALKHLGDYAEAVKRLKRALRNDPDNEEVLRELDVVTQEKAKHEAKEKTMYRNMFGFGKINVTDEDKKFEQLLESVNDDFKNLVVSQVNALMQSEDQDSIKVSFGATPIEKEYYQKVCQQNNLSFRVTKTEGVETFIITKKS